MTRRITLVALAALAMAVTLTLPVSAQTGTRAEIEKITQSWQKAFNAGDAAAVAALYAKDGELMPPGAEPVTGTDAIKAGVEGDIKQGGKMTLTTEEVIVSGNTALETGKWVASSADGKHLDHGPYATFYKKEGGSWKIYRDIYNSSMAQK
jgi:uncharacterized protein (TIGR02246 family)